MHVLVTGGAGFIGTHTCVELLENGVDIVVMDNYSNSSPDALRAVEKITGKTFPIYECDMLDYDKFEKIFEENKIDAVIHFAGLRGRERQQAAGILPQQHHRHAEPPAPDAQV